MIKTHVRKIVLALVQMASIAFAQPATVAVPDREQLERRISAVSTLIETSSAAQQIERSAVADAMAMRAVAREIFLKAKAAFGAGDLVTASRLLPEASVKMFEAVRLAAPEQVTNGKIQSDLKARQESVRSLLAAQRRIAAEKGDVKGMSETTALLESLLQKSDALIAKNDYSGARTELDRAYLVAKAAIGSMRGGDTLVRTLAFGSKKEEFDYELDRNETHKMLLRVAADDERKRLRAEAAVTKADELRGAAEVAAKSGDLIKAIKLLEDSTAELVRAIRGAGLYIP